MSVWLLVLASTVDCHPLLLIEAPVVAMGVVAGLLAGVGEVEASLGVSQGQLLLLLLAVPSLGRLDQHDAASLSAADGTHPR